MNRKEWLIFGLGGIAVSLMAIFTILASNIAETLFEQLFSRWTEQTIWITPIGFIVIAWIIKRFAPEAEGGGVSQTLTALRDDYILYNRYLSLPALLGKFLLIPGYLIGASMGYEGPIVQMGAVVMVQIARYFQITRQDLLRLAIMAGGGAGLAAAFGAPLSGIIFTIEELHEKNLSAFSYAVLTTILISGLLCEIVLGHYIYLGHVVNELDINFQGLLGYSMIPLCGIIGGYTGVFFAKSIVGLSKWLRQRKIPWFILAGITGLMVMGLNFSSMGEIAGSGQNTVRDLMNHMDVLSFYALLKALATLATFISGIPTGLFTPSLAIGAGIGDILTHLFTSVQPEYLILLMMTGFLCGSLQAPLTSFAIVMEISGLILF